jgi:hypothetical protein
MKYQQIVVSLGAVVLLSGCASLSFAPPSVNLATRVTTTQSGSCTAAMPTQTRVDNHNSVESALFLIDNYMQAYGCALATTSNGRQMFQIPSHLAALLGVAGAAFGGSPDLALGSGIAASTFNSANGYWAPQEKASVIDSAYDAILCIRTESVGIPFIDTTIDAPAAVSDGVGGTVSINPNWRYFGMISAALRQVDRITASRLRSIGKFDPAGLVAEIEALDKKIKDAELAKQAAADAAPPTPVAPATEGATPPGINDGQDDGGGTNRAPSGAGTAGASADSIMYSLDLDLLQPKVQRCVVRAKL